MYLYSHPEGKEFHFKARNLQRTFDDNDEKSQ